MKLVQLNRMRCLVTVTKVVEEQVSPTTWRRVRNMVGNLDRDIKFPLDVNLYFHIQNQNFRSTTS